MAIFNSYVKLPEGNNHKPQAMVPTVKALEPPAEHGKDHDPYRQWEFPIDIRP
jgi:hypothetical protein